MTLDTLIRNATVFDGRQIEPQKIAVGIIGDEIAYIGEDLSNSAAHDVIDARGLFLCPGFIDSHASTGFGYTLPDAGANKLYQGVTTEIIGNCGTSPAPIGELMLTTMHKLAGQIGFDFTWRSLADWFNMVAAYGLPFNSGTYVGHNTIRAGVCTEPQNINDDEKEQMVELVSRAMQDGALGLSTGLVYAPGSFADTEEIIALVKIVAKYGGLYVSHMRNERENLEQSIEEIIAISCGADIRVLVSHLKAAEKPNWGKIAPVLKRVEAARQEGVDIHIEVYPYTAVSTKLSTFIPKEALQDGIDGMVNKLKTESWRKKASDWLENRQTDYASMLMITESQPDVQGKTIREIATQQQSSPGDAIVDILIHDPEAWIVYDCMSQADMEAAILWQDSIVCSDSWSYPVNAKTQIGNPHPRTFGAFTRFLEHFTLRDEKMPFGRALRKITSLPAHIIGIPKRGQIRQGFFADLVLLDPANVQEKATYTNPRQYSTGTEYVWVNGVKVLERGELYDTLPGRIIRKNHHAV